MQKDDIEDHICKLMISNKLICQKAISKEWCTESKAELQLKIFRISDSKNCINQ